MGDALVRDPRVGKVMFTGSVKTGMKVIEASAGNMPRLTLELGGNDAAIVLPDVDPQAIAEGLFWGAFINNAAPLVQEEQFGPALPIIRYTDLEQAVEWANGVDVGLGASVWSADRDQALAIAAPAGRDRVDQQPRRHRPARPVRRRQALRIRPGVRRRGTESRLRPAGLQRLGLSTPATPHTEADVTRTMSATLGFLAAAEA